MGHRGPPKKPAKLKLLQGAPNAKKLLESEPEYEKPNNAPAPPDYLSDAARAVWEERAEAVFNADLLTEGDMETFGVFCEYAATMRDINQRVNDSKTEPVFLSEKSNYVGKNPLFTVRNEAFKEFLMLSKHFGMTPAARADIAMPDKKGESTWAQTMG